MYGYKERSIRKTDIKKARGMEQERKGESEKENERDGEQ
jgi:hypothetical protein